MAKPKAAFYWCSSCGGCEATVTDLNEGILKITDAFDIVMWPLVMDFKKKDIEAMKDGEIAVSFISGAIGLTAEEEMAKLLRRKSELVVAFGTCAHLGGIPGLANFWTRESVFQRVYKEIPSVDNPAGTLPQEKTLVDGVTLTLPALYDTVKTLDQTIPVDYYLPGCPPPPNLLAEAVNAILNGKLPPKGSVLAPPKALCDTCPRETSKPDKIAISEVKRPYQIKIDPEKCFLLQGLICMGPATRSGCGETCIKANMPCRGCFGPVNGVIDQGAESISMIASLLGLDGEGKMAEAETTRLFDNIADPAGTVYRFSMAASFLRRKGIE
jgi:F420-non-reducing hydrogenase small subunit